MYLFRLDDAAEYMNIQNWKNIEELFEKYDIKPIVGVIPNLEDKELISKYNKNLLLWNDVRRWESKGWDIALHGYNHVFTTKSGGINPVNYVSEFAGVSKEIQKLKIRSGIEIFKLNKIQPKVFFAPAHTFDLNTLEAIRGESEIRIISDTFARNVYKKHGFFFVPQQIGYPRKLNFKIVTICLHPNTMDSNGFESLEKFIIENRNKVTSLSNIALNDSRMSVVDLLLNKVYFLYRKTRNIKK